MFDDDAVLDTRVLELEDDDAVVVADVDTGNSFQVGSPGERLTTTPSAYTTAPLWVSNTVFPSELQVLALDTKLETSIVSEDAAVSGE